MKQPGELFRDAWAKAKCKYRGAQWKFIPFEATPGHVRKEYEEAEAEVLAAGRQEVLDYIQALHLSPFQSARDLVHVVSTKFSPKPAPEKIKLQTFNQIVFTKEKLARTIFEDCAFHECHFLSVPCSINGRFFACTGEAP